MNKNYLNFPDADLLLFQESGKESKLSLDLEFFEESGNTNNDDPFISYRDDSLSPGYCGTPDSSVPRSSSSGSPDHFSTTPSTPDSGSLSDIPNLDPIDEFANLDLKLAMSPTTVLDKDCDPYEEINFQSRAPYISMNIDDDFPLISPSNSVMWGPQEPIHKRAAGDSITVVPVEPPSKSPKSKQVSDSSTAKSSLAALLQSDLKKHPAGKPEKTKVGSSVTHRDAPSHKKWHGSTASDGNNRNSVLTAKVSNNTGFQKQSSLYNGNSSSGHIVMLDTLPSRKQLPSSKSSGYQHRKSGHNLNTAFLSNHSQAPPPLGSHTATVKVNDRLIKVQVSVSELPAATIEQQRSPSSSPVEPVPPKRLSPSLPGPTESPKRMKVDNHSVVCQGIPATESVLLNLLISGEDASRGYLSSGNSKYTEVQQSKPVALPLPTQNANHQQSQQQQQQQNDSVQESVLLASESELLDSFLNISQYDADVNAPIQVSHLLQGEDLLDALDLPPSLRDVPALV